MKIFGKVLWHSKNKTHWPDPKKSIGERIGAVKDGTRTYWEAIGPARKAWIELGPTIKDCIESTACGYVSGLSVEIYMIGSSTDAASPQILVCSKSSKARNQVLEAIRRREILKDYPAIELAGIDQLPDLLAQDDIEFSYLPDLSSGNDITVLTSPLDKPFGRRLFIPKQNGTTYRRATAGPIVYNNNKVYQLTVGHAFLNFGDFPLSEPEPGNLGDHNLDNKSDAEERNSVIKREVTRENEAETKGAWITGSVSAKGQGFFSSDPKPPPMISGRQASLDSGVEFSSASSSGTNSQFQETALTPLRKFSRVGKLALLSDTSTNQSPDYALVELEQEYSEGRNEVPYNPNGSQIFLQVERPAKKGPKDINAMKDVNIITMTASSGFIIGRLCATASYIRFPNQRTLQELYPVRLGGKLVDGDCGAGIVDQSSGNLHGHIVAGIAGTGRAYIVPVEHVFRDIQEKLGGEVTLVPPGKILAKSTDSPWSDELKLAKFLWVPVHKKRLEPLRVVEFASEEYFNQFKQPSRSPKHKKKPHPSPPRASNLATPLISTSSSHFTSTRPEGSVGSIHEFAQGHKSTRTLRLPRPLMSSAPAMCTSSTADKDITGRINDESGGVQRSKGLTFEDRFFTLPSDIQVQVAAYLNVPDMLNLSLASKSWNTFISIHQTPISRAFLQNNPVPCFVTNLYPPPAPSDLNLQYICGLWYRLSITSKMATLMAVWITKDIFLRKDEAQRRDFLPHQTRMRRRLTPLLFTLFHFLETYRHLHLRHILDNDHCLLPEGFTINPIERHIMNMYNSETLLQVHQIFPFLVAYLDRKLRPPSYYGGLERKVRGYTIEPTPENFHAGILCIGGLDTVVKLSAIVKYETRRAFVDDWYNSVSSARIVPRELKRRVFKRVSFNDTKNYIVPQEPSLAAPSSYQDKGKAPDRSPNQNTTNFLGARPMPQLSPEHAQILLQDLPALKQIWIPTAEALLLARNAVERRQDIKKNGQAMHELIVEEFTSADELFYGSSEKYMDVDNKEVGWGDLFGDLGGSEDSVVLR